MSPKSNPQGGKKGGGPLHGVTWTHQEILFSVTSWAAALAAAVGAQDIPGGSASPPGKGPGSYQHFGKEWALVQGCQPGDIGCDLNRPVSSESCCSRAWAAAGRAQQSPVPSLSWCGGVKRACHAPGCCLFIPCTEALICHSPSLQELVREMVDADVELMKNNPNA